MLTAGLKPAPDAVFGTPRGDLDWRRGFGHETGKWFGVVVDPIVVIMSEHQLAGPPSRPRQKCGRQPAHRGTAGSD